jgi:cell shape-determining protein MreC
MQSFLNLLETRTSFNALLQIGIDVIILGLLAALFYVKRPGVSQNDETLVATLEKIMAETAEISRKFEANLQKRQELLQQITSKLDERIQEGEKLCARLDRLSRVEADKAAARYSLNSKPKSQTSDQQKVIALARKGLPASEISKLLKRPVGEIELILNL